MMPQQMLAAIESSAKGDANTVATSSSDDSSTTTQDEMAKMQPQEMLRMLEQLGSSNDQVDSEQYLRLSKALYELDDNEEDGDFDICLDDLIPGVICID